MVHDEIEQLRAEIALLKKDMKHVLGLLDQERSEDGTRPQYRPGAHCLPLIVNATDDSVEIRLNDKNMLPRVVLSVDENGACLEFRNAGGKLIAELAQAPDGSGQFCVCDADGNPRAGMRATEYGGLVNVLNSESKPQVILIGTERGGEVHVTNDQLRTGVKLIASERGGIITVHETSGQIMGSFSGDHHFGSLTIHGTLGSPAVSLAATDEGGIIVFYDADGESTSILP
jgi:hypothetical protein